MSWIRMAVTGRLQSSTVSQEWKLLRKEWEKNVPESVQSVKIESARASTGMVSAPVKNVGTRGPSQCVAQYRCCRQEAVKQASE